MSKGCCIIWLSVTGARLPIITPFQWPKPELIFPLLRCCSPKINAVGKVILRFRIKATIEYRLPTFSVRLQLLVSFFLFSFFVFVCFFLRSTSVQIWSHVEQKSGTESKLLTQNSQILPRSCPVPACEARSSELFVRSGARHLGSELRNKLRILRVSS